MKAGTGDSGVVAKKMRHGSSNVAEHGHFESDFNTAQDRHGVQSQ